MRFRYRNEDEMKDSEVEWIGKIPENWQVKKLKYLAKIDTGNKDTQDKEENGVYPFFVRSDNVEKSNSYSFDGEAILTAGDGVGVAKVFHYINGKFAYHQRVYKISNFKGICGKFLYYYIKVNLGKEVEKISAKTTVDSLRLPMFLNFPVLINDELGKKEAIFLDEKVLQFDTIISKKEELIKKIEEAKKSLISEVVTGKAKVLKTKEGYKLEERNEKEMKDSKVSWLENIPESWEVKPIKYLFQLRNERNKKEKSDVQILSLFTALGVRKQGDVVARGNKVHTVEDYKIVYPKDIVVNIILAWMGAIGMSFDNGVISPAYDIYRPINDMINSKFYHYLFRTGRFSGECYKKGRGIMEMRWRTYSDEFKSIVVPKPSIEEQRLIVSFLDARIEEMDNLIMQTSQYINRLKEAKQSLISEVITGKIEVLD